MFLGSYDVTLCVDMGEQMVWGGRHTVSKKSGRAMIWVSYDFESKGCKLA